MRYGRLVRTLLAASTCAVWILALTPARPAPATRRPGFRNVTSRSKFSYTTNNSFAGRKYFPQPMCGGVAVFDFDNDGRLDIFFTNGAKLPELKKTDPSYYNCLLRQSNDGTFEDVTVSAGLTGEPLDFNFGVAVGDFFPRIGLTAFYGGTSTELHNLVSSGANVWSAAASARRGYILAQRTAA